MFFGQETNNWYNERRMTIEGVQEFYDDFFNGEECWDYGKQFWIGVSKFVDSLRLKYSDKKITVLWNNRTEFNK